LSIKVLLYFSLALVKLINQDLILEQPHLIVNIARFFKKSIIFSLNLLFLELELLLISVLKVINLELVPLLLFFL
jgi:hypothetical protein